VLDAFDDHEIALGGSSQAQRQVRLAPSEVEVLDAREHLQGHLRESLLQASRERRQQIVGYARRGGDPHDAAGAWLASIGSALQLSGPFGHSPRWFQQALGARSAESLRSLQAFVRRNPSVSVRLGHQAHRPTLAAR
jgi:hypothetical protein